MLPFCMFVELQHRSAASPRSASSRRNLGSLSDSALDCSFSCVFCGRSELSSLESAVADKHRVLPVFSRNCQASSPLEATLTSILVNVDSKWFTAKLNLLDATLTKNTGEEGPLLTGPRSVPRCLCGNPFICLGSRNTGHGPRRLPYPSHCGARTLVQQFAKAREFFTIRGNNSAPPGV